MTKSNLNRPKLQKFLADAGLCSRRKGEEWILDGLVSINGKQASLGERVSPDSDIIKVNGKLIQPKQVTPVTFIVNKPKGFTCSNEDKHADRLVFELLESKYRGIRLFCAGRLDVDSEGMVILTNDEDEFLKLDEIKPSRGKSLKSNKLDIYMSHGKKREIRRIFYHFGYKVKRLRRVSIGGLGIRNMSLGQSRILKKEEIDLLFPK
jgi:23S rRNA pseudouridine2605 synthase